MNTETFAIILQFKWKRHQLFLLPMLWKIQWNECKGNNSQNRPLLLFRCCNNLRKQYFINVLYKVQSTINHVYMQYSGLDIFYTSQPYWSHCSSIASYSYLYLDCHCPLLSLLSKFYTWRFLRHNQYKTISTMYLKKNNMEQYYEDNKIFFALSIVEKRAEE